MKCLRHNVILKLDAEGKTRVLELPRGSWGPLGPSVAQCVLLTMKNPKPGKYGVCEVVEI